MITRRAGWRLFLAGSIFATTLNWVQQSFGGWVVILVGAPAIVVIEHYVVRRYEQREHSE